MKIPAIYIWSVLLVALATATIALTSRTTSTSSGQSPMSFATTEPKTDALSLAAYQYSNATEDDIRYGVVYWTAIQRLKEVADDLERHQLTSDAEAVRTAYQKLRSSARSIPWTIEPPERQVFSFFIADYGR